MQWNTLSHRQRGGIIGAGAAAIVFVGYFVYLLKVFIFDGWADMAHTAGQSTANLLGWIGIYGFMALVVAGMIGMVALPIFYTLGSVIGWACDKAKASKA